MRPGFRIEYHLFFLVTIHFRNTSDDCNTIINTISEMVFIGCSSGSIWQTSGRSVYQPME